MKFYELLKSPQSILVYPGEFYTVVAQYKTGKFIKIRSSAVVSKKNKETISLGDMAWEMKDRLPNTALYINPFLDSAISNSLISLRLIVDALYKAHIDLNSLFRKPKAIFLIENDAETNLAKINELSKRLGFAKTKFFKLPVFLNQIASKKVSSSVSVVVTIGLSKTTIYIVNNLQIVNAKTLNVGALDLLRRLDNYLVTNFSLSTGETTRYKLLSAFSQLDTGKYLVVRGKSLEDGFPRSIRVESKQLFEILCDDLNSISQAVLGVIKTAPSELTTDISRNGILIFSESSIAAFCEKYFSSELDFNVSTVDFLANKTAKIVQKMQDVHKSR